MVLVGSFSQIYSDSTKENRNILKVCILDKVCIFKSVDKNGIVREISAIQKKSNGQGRWLSTHTMEGEQVTFTHVHCDMQLCTHI